MVRKFNTKKEIGSYADQAWIDMIKKSQKLAKEQKSLMPVANLYDKYSATSQNLKEAEEIENSLKDSSSQLEMLIDIVSNLKKQSTVETTQDESMRSDPSEGSTIGKVSGKTQSTKLRELLKTINTDSD